jgi:hypothetical protein
MLNTYTVKGVVETPFEMEIQAESDHDAENIAYERLYNASENLVYIEDTVISEDSEYETGEM